jgi:carboxymethylenebutenolidase
VWNSFTTDGRAGVEAELISIPGGNGQPIQAYYARSLSVQGPRPGILSIHHAPGFDEWQFEFAERLSRHGYDVITPDLYGAFGHGNPEDIAAKVRAEGGVRDESVIADATAALTWLKARPDHSGKVGIIGPCSGGRHAVLVASSVPGIDAVVDLWGGGVVQLPDQITPQRPVPPITLTEKLTAPILGIFGNDDHSPPPDQVDLHEAELKKFNKDYEFHRYDGAGHGFFYYDRPLYRQEQAMDAWGKIFAFFADKLAG